MVLASLLLVAVCPAAAQVRPEDQVETLARVFSFDRSLSGSTVTVLLVENDGTAGELDEIRASFSGRGLTVRTTSPSSLATDIGSASVVYFAAASVTPEAARVVSSAGALSLSGDPADTESGLVSVAAERLGTRTGIVVSLPRLEEEGHELTAQLLKQPWVRVVRRKVAAAESTLAPCRITKFASPAYPTHARRLGIEGTVTLRVLVDDGGAAGAVEVEESVPQLESAAVRAARKSTYTAPGWCQLRIPFTLESD